MYLRDSHSLRGSATAQVSEGMSRAHETCLSHGRAGPPLAGSVRRRGPVLYKTTTLQRQPRVIHKVSHIFKDGKRSYTVAPSSDNQGPYTGTAQPHLRGQLRVIFGLLFFGLHVPLYWGPVQILEIEGYVEVGGQPAFKYASH